MIDAQGNINQAKEIVEICKDEEADSFDSLPEGIQMSEKGETLSENVDCMDDIFNELDSLYDTIEEQIEAILEVIDR